MSPKFIQLYKVLDRKDGTLVLKTLGGLVLEQYIYDLEHPRGRLAWEWWKFRNTSSYLSLRWHALFRFRSIQDTYFSLRFFRTYIQFTKPFAIPILFKF